jgi:hypothetical protein
LVQNLQLAGRVRIASLVVSEAHRRKLLVTDDRLIIIRGIEIALAGIDDAERGRRPSIPAFLLAGAKLARDGGRIDRILRGLYTDRYQGFAITSPGPRLIAAPHSMIM